MKKIVNSMYKGKYLDRWHKMDINNKAYICKYEHNVSFAKIFTIVHNNWYYKLEFIIQIVMCSRLLIIASYIKNIVLYLIINKRHIYDCDDLAVLDGIHTLDLLKCIYKAITITNVSMLNNVKNLNLSYWKGLDVSILGNAHTLILYGCTKIKGICELTGVYRLNVRNTDMTEMTDISNNNNGINNVIRALSNMHTVIIDNESINKMDCDMSILGNVHTLNINIYKDSDMLDTTKMANVHTLYICVCSPEQDVRGLRSVNTLYIIKSDKIKNMDILYYSHNQTYPYFLYYIILYFIFMF